MTQLPDEFYAEREESRNYDALLDITMNAILGYDDENKDNSFGATLVSNGIVIRGLIVTSHEWQRLQVNFLAESSSEGANFLGEVFVSAFKDLNEMRKNFSVDHPDRPRARYWIHMKDVVIHSSTGVIKTDLLRVSIDSVSAWTLGN